MKTNLLFSRVLIGMALIVLGVGFSACDTKSGKKPKVITGEAVVNPANGTVKCNGYVETAGSSAVFDRGICFTSEDKKPTLKDKHVGAGEGLGDFTCTLSDIKEGSYKYCAYATNDAGTAYGDTLVFVMTEKGNNGGENGGESGGGNEPAQPSQPELTGSYLKLGDNVTYLKLAILEITYQYAVQPAFYTYTRLMFYDMNSVYCFLVYGGCYAAITSLPTGTWDFGDNYRTNYHTYDGWWAKGLNKVKETAFQSAVVKQSGSLYTIDFVIDSTSKLHYEGAVQVTTKTENYN